MRSIGHLLVLALVTSLVAPAAAARKPNFKKSDFKLEYRDTLTDYARGDAQGAISNLVELEARNADNGHLEPQWKAKLSVVRDLIGDNPHLLVPVSQFHQKAYLAHLEGGSYALAAASRSLTIELAEIYAERVRGTQGEKLASAVMTSLAGHLHAASMDPTAAALYRRAIEVDPESVAALLGLVGILERHGEYEEALPFLRRIHRIVPTDPESRLRMAIQLIRLEQHLEGEQMLRSLTDERVREPRWVFSLAYQELARRLVDREEFTEAVNLLDAGARALPGDPTLPILQAYASDRAGRPSSKTKLAEALYESAAAGLESPRYRYSQMPRRALEEVRVTLEDETSAQLPTLAEALGVRSVLASKGVE